mmetsp:Transcript_516/g.1810  ORF Transcript_516/g.1810 Transcript_516/m.1810 type:complete len:250 (-) Transcript_516:2117-2866(-)
MPPESNSCCSCCSKVTEADTWVSTSRLAPGMVPHEAPVTSTASRRSRTISVSLTSIGARAESCATPPVTNNEADPAVEARTVVPDTDTTFSLLLANETRHVASLPATMSWPSLQVTSARTLVVWNWCWVHCPSTNAPGMALSSESATSIFTLAGPQIFIGKENGSNSPSETCTNTEAVPRLLVPSSVRTHVPEPKRETEASASSSMTQDVSVVVVSALFGSFHTCLAVIVLRTGNWLRCAVLNNSPKVG